MINIVNPFAARLESSSVRPPSTGPGQGRSDQLPEAPVWQSHRPDGAFELKFVVSDGKAEAIRDWARQQLQPDPHATESPDEHERDHYRVHSLYLDTPRLDIFHRIPAIQSSKYRLRRYGDERIVWLEKKQKAEGVVRKQRVATVDEDLVHRLLGPVDDSWEGTWFREQIEGLELRPSCHVTYQRFARVGMTPAGPVRLTLDSGVGGERSNEWAVPRGLLASAPLLDGRCILELKFRETVPVLFKELMQDLQLSTGRFSKYRETVRRFVSPSASAAATPSATPSATLVEGADA